MGKVIMLVVFVAVLLLILIIWLIHFLYNKTKKDGGKIRTSCLPFGYDDGIGGMGWLISSATIFVSLHQMVITL